jgi:hypothetical protein
MATGKQSANFRQNMLVPQVVSANTTVTHGDCYKVFTQSSGSSKTFTLPKARAGDGPFFFNVTSAASVIVVAPQAADSMGGLTAGTNITLGALAGYLIGFYCNTTGTWSPIETGSGSVTPAIFTSNVTLSPPAGVIPLTINPTSSAGVNIRFVAFSPTQKQNYLDWYESDNSTRRAYLGFGNVNDETFIINTDTASGTISLRTNGTPRVLISATGAVTISGNVGFNGAAAPALPTGFGTPVGAAVIASYNITDAGGANSNTNKCVAEILTVLKSYGLIGA